MVYNRFLSHYHSSQYKDKNQKRLCVYNCGIFKPTICIPNQHMKEEFFSSNPKSDTY
jgi:hypothetical protein